MSKTQLRDIVVLIPGILGSSLKKHNTDIWAVSGQAISSAIKTLGSSLDQLAIANETGAPDLGDGITAHRLIRDAHLVPGLLKVDGYTRIINLIDTEFDVVTKYKGTGNFLEFPYDWRRDCRVSAMKLKDFINTALPLWRQSSGVSDAKVILIGHSMGGLISQYYLEVLQGWADCKALITLGTPYRGSVLALNYICNGYKGMFCDLTDVLRSMNSVHQLLPIYKALKVNDKYKRVIAQSLPGMDMIKAADAIKFHREIETAAKKNVKNPAYGNTRYKIFPIIGVRQPTIQSAEIVNGKVVANMNLPENIDQGLAGGDGTVPQLSAIPIELSDEYSEVYFAERHSSIQSNASVLEHVYQILKRLQTTGLKKIRGGTSLDVGGMPAISVDVEDLFLPDEPVRINAKLINVTGEIKVGVQSVKGHYQKEFDLVDGDTLEIEEKLPKGLYRLEVSAVSASNFVSPVHDLFEVM